MRPSTWMAKSPSPESPATSRPPSRDRPVSARASPRTLTAPAVLRSCTPARTGPFRAIACWPPARPIPARPRSSPSRAAFSSREQPCSGCVTSWGSSAPRASRRPSPRRCPPPAASISSPHSSAWVHPIGTRWRAGFSAASAVPPAVPTSCARRSRASPTRLESWWSAWRAMPANRCASCAWMAAQRSTIFSCSFRPTSWANPSCARWTWRPPRWAPRTWPDWPPASGEASRRWSRSGVPKGASNPGCRRPSVSICTLAGARPWHDAARQTSELLFRPEVPDCNPYNSLDGLGPPYGIYLAETGRRHPDAKPLPELGAGVNEIVCDYDTDTYRAVYKKAG
ncbi:hypothetical protein SBA4_1500006 [Candidatus Sulfopaludibacter sp. SbA4]|nr:hypothetical protein SBA4_1500006 [Candidatus Sulfopaludibacter sp. SbA4]